MTDDVLGARIRVLVAAEVVAIDEQFDDVAALSEADVVRHVEACQRAEASGLGWWLVIDYSDGERVAFSSIAELLAHMLHSMGDDD